MFTPNNPTQHDTEYILDDKRKVIVNARDFTSFQFSLYKRGMFKRQRPDLSNYDFVIWKEKYRLGEYYLNEMRRKLNSEITRFHFQGHAARTKDANRHFEDQLLQLSQPFIKGCNFHIERTWEEASKIAAYMTKVGNRVQKYYLDYPYAKSHITAEKARELEDELATRLAREMRKAPIAKSQGGDDE